MSAHLSHKIRWDYLADYLTGYANSAITFPVGDCGRIHATKKKHRMQIDMRNYITDDMICTDEDCRTTGERKFRKNDKPNKPFAKGQRDESKLKMFMDSFYAAVHEFALTEMKSPVKPVDRDDTMPQEKLSLMHLCGHCDDFIECLEFGDNKRLIEYSESELRQILSCQHGGQAVGNSIRFFMYYIVRFYIVSNVIVYMNLKQSDWPDFMKPGSYFRRMLTYACDGQTFLPHSRYLLERAMIDADATRLLSKRLFRAIYLYVMVKLRLDSSCEMDDCFQFYYFSWN